MKNLPAATCPVMGATGPCPWLDLQQRRQRLRGWLASGLAVALTLSGATLLAVRAAPAPEPFVLALAPAPMPALMAMPLPVAEPVIQPETVESPDVPTPNDAPDLAPPDLAPSDLTPDVTPPEPFAPDLAAPMPEAAPEVLAKAPPPPKPKPQKVAKAEPKPEKKAAKTSKPQAASQASAPAAAATSNVSPKAWAASVAKQIRKTKKQKAGGSGTVQVGFTVGADGSLQGVRVLQSSGDAAVDALGLDHIRRAAPFAPPPEGAARQMAFAFEVR